MRNQEIVCISVPTEGDRKRMRGWTRPSALLSLVVAGLLCLTDGAVHAAPYDCQDMYSNLRITGSYIVGDNTWFDTHSVIVRELELVPGTNGGGIDYVWKVGACAYNTEDRHHMDIAATWPSSYLQAMPECPPAGSGEYPTISLGIYPSHDDANWRYSSGENPGQGVMGWSHPGDRWDVGDVITISVTGCGSACTDQMIKIEIQDGCGS